MKDEKIKEAINLIIAGLELDPLQEDLIDTPNRVVKTYREIFRGHIETPPDLKTFENTKLW